MDRKIVFGRMIVPLLLMVVVVPVSWSMGDGSVDVFRKVCFVPTFLLTQRGLDSVFPDFKNEECRFRTRFWFQFLSAILLSLYIVFLTTPANDENLSIMLRQVIIMSVSMTAIMMAFVWYDRRSRLQP